MKKTPKSEYINQKIKNLILEPEEDTSKGRGRPVGTYKHGSLNIFEWKKLKSSLKTLHEFRKDIIQEITHEIELLHKVDNAIIKGNRLKNAKSKK